jgi:hypothetical protein
MISPDIKSLGDFAITAAGTQVGDAVDGLEGIAECDVQVRFAYGSGGSTCRVFIQTSLDQGVTWGDLWCFTATTASKTQWETITPSGGTPASPTDGSLADDTVITKPKLGDRLRAKIISTGTYSGSTLVSIRATAR